MEPDRELSDEDRDASAARSDARSAQRLAALLDELLPHARRGLEEGEEAPAIFAEAETAVMAIRDEPPVLAESLELDIHDGVFVEDPIGEPIPSDTLEGTLFAAARTVEKINARRIAGLQVPRPLIAERKETLRRLAAHIANERPPSLWQRLKGIFKNA